MSAVAGAWDDGEPLLLFQNLTSAPSVSFWRELARRKLDELGLDDAAIPIVGTFRVGTQQHAGRHRDDYSAAVVDAASDVVPPILFDLSESSFVANHNANAAAPAEAAALAPDFVDAAGMPGLLFNFNTVEAFKRADKNQVLRECALRQLHQRREDVDEGASISGGASICNAQFVVLGYADLKKHTFVYWVGFPTLRLDRPQLPRLIANGGLGIGGSQPLSAFMPAAETRRQLAAQLFSRAAPPLPPPPGGGETGRWTMPLHFVIVCTVVDDDAAADGGSDGSSGKPSGYHAVDCSVHPLEALPQQLLLLLAPEAVTTTRRHVVCLGCVDPSSSPRSSCWPLRSLLNSVQLAKLPGLPPVVRVVCIRDAVSSTAALASALASSLGSGGGGGGDGGGDALVDSVVFDVRLPALADDVAAAPQFFGWEADQRGRARPRQVNLASQVSERVSE